MCWWVWLGVLAWGANRGWLERGVASSGRLAAALGEAAGTLRPPDEPRVQ